MLSDCEVKKLAGLSSAELTFLPVASRFWVTLISSAVFCSDNRFCRTPADKYDITHDNILRSQMASGRSAERLGVIMTD